MLNKILSKKIKFPLSFRGAKQRSNLSGFSLIELMVAVVILVMAIFGIFLAFSTGFQGMADARDRTVATNYAREAMEDIKNKDFDQIITQSRNYINGTKYEREVIVQSSTNLKEVTTKVYWEDRNNNPKMVETDMVVHFIETTAGTPNRIMLIADPYNILTDGTSTLTAVIKDDKGNTVTTPEHNISFLITQVSESAGGDLSQSSKTTIKGKATTTFASSGGEGEVTITASATGLTSDSVTITVTNIDKPVKINLTANPMFMTLGSVSIITVTIINAAGDTVTEATNEITFSVSVLGTLSNQSALEEGVATIDLISSTTPGTITVTASANDLEPDVVVVITGGQITLSASLIEVPKGERSVITVTTKNVYEVPIKYMGYINLNISPTSGSGVFEENGLSTVTIYFDGSFSSETVIFKATAEGTVDIAAEAQVEILTSADPLTLYITEELVPDHIEVYAIPTSIPAGGTEISLITAKVMTEGNITVTSYNELVTFETTAGSLESYDNSFTDGIATAVLYTLTSEAVTATITVSSPYLISGSTEVGFYIGPDHIILSAVPQNISVDGQNCTVTAKIVDNNGTLISDYNENITFIISPWPYTIRFSKATTYILTQKVKKGIATVTLISGDYPGTAVIDAYSGDISGTLNIPVGISLTLEGDPIYNSENKSVSFNINIVGAALLLEEMQVSWDLSSSETLNKIEIKTPSENGPVITVFDDLTTPASNGELINFEYVTLYEGTSNVKIYFNAEAIMSGKNMEVIFNPNSGNYTIEFTIPEPTL